MQRSTQLILIALPLALLPGCASLPADKLEARDYRNFDYAEQFKYDRRKCLANGGRIVVYATGKVDRDGIPKHRERYFCA